MTQTRQLIGALKKCLRARGATYRDVAGVLKLSEASVKRLFSEQSFSLKRIEQVCGYLDLSLFDLARMAERQREADATHLSIEQEEALAKQPRLLSMFYLLLLGWSNRDIADRLELTATQMTRALAQLDRLRLVELQTNNRVRLLTSTRVSWRRDGPIRRRYERRVMARYFDYSFDAGEDCLTLESDELSAASAVIMRRKIGRLIAEFHELADIDRQLPTDERASFGLMLAYRPWTYWDVVLPEST